MSRESVGQQQLPMWVLQAAAQAHRVCVRPVLAQVLDTATGRRELVPIPCGSTRAAQCAPCADKARRLRMAQCREGWHLEHEPPRHPASTATATGSETGEAADTDSVDDPHDIGESGSGRRVRSTRRRQDVPDLPRLPMTDRTLGATFTAANGRTYRPSMFLTVTLPSYGPVRRDGTPVHPDRYDYRRAALDALHFSKLIDRLFQNLRRCAGYDLQYFASIEPQHRLAPHLHAAVRGVLPRAVIRQIVAATYHQLWWPPIDQVRHTQDNLPVWVDGVGYLDAASGQVLPTWDQALDTLDSDPHAAPLHVLRLGRQLDMQGVIAATGQADARIGYLTKYLAKSMADPMTGDDDDPTPAQARHLDRLHEELRWLPCTPGCANWLRYGIQPAHATAGLVPGHCSNKAHDRDHLGCGGRRVLVSRKWTGKTLTQHRADRAEVVRQTLTAAGLPVPDRDRLATTQPGPGGRPRYRWTLINPAGTPLSTYADIICASITQATTWRTQYEHAKRAGPPHPLSATPHPAAPAA